MGKAKRASLGALAACCRPVCRITTSNANLRVEVLYPRPGSPFLVGPGLYAGGPPRPEKLALLVADLPYHICALEQLHIHLIADEHYAIQRDASNCLAVLTRAPQDVSAATVLVTHPLC